MVFGGAAYRTLARQQRKRMMAGTALRDVFMAISVSIVLNRSGAVEVSRNKVKYIYFMQESCGLPASVFQGVTAAGSAEL
jgi:hypothetical protein